MAPATERRSVVADRPPERRSAILAVRTEPSVVTAMHLISRACGCSTGEILREALVLWLEQSLPGIDPALLPEAEQVTAALAATGKLRPAPEAS